MSQIAQYVGSDAFSCTRYSLSLSLSLTQTTTMLPILHSLVQAKDEMVDASMMIIWVKRSKTTLVLEQDRRVMHASADLPTPISFSR